MLMMDATNFCVQSMNLWQVLGYVVLIMKIVIPLLLIVFGMVDLGKAVVSSDEKAISKAVSTLIKRFIAAIVVFFIPALVTAIFGVLEVTKSVSADFNKCVKCVTSLNCEKDGSTIGI